MRLAFGQKVNKKEKITDNKLLHVSSIWSKSEFTFHSFKFKVTFCSHYVGNKTKVVQEKLQSELVFGHH